MTIGGRVTMTQHVAWGPASGEHERNGIIVGHGANGTILVVWDDATEGQDGLPHIVVLDTDQVAVTGDRIRRLPTRAGYERLNYDAALAAAMGIPTLAAVVRQYRRTGHPACLLAMLDNDPTGAVIIAAHQPRS
jgi:hypothetical protein